MTVFLFHCVFFQKQIPEYVSVAGHEEQGTGKSPHDPDHNSTAIYSGKPL